MLTAERVVAWYLWQQTHHNSPHHVKAVMKLNRFDSRAVLNGSDVLLHIRMVDLYKLDGVCLLQLSSLLSHG